MRDSALSICMVAHIPSDGVSAFQEYEATALSLLCDYNGQLIHRYQNTDGTLEVHIVQFASADDFAAYRTSETRQQLAPLLERSGAKVTVESVTDIT